MPGRATWGRIRVSQEAEKGKGQSMAQRLYWGFDWKEWGEAR